MDGVDGVDGVDAAWRMGKQREFQRGGAETQREKKLCDDGFAFATMMLVRMGRDG